MNHHPIFSRVRRHKVSIPPDFCSNFMGIIIHKIFHVVNKYLYLPAREDTVDFPSTDLPDYYEWISVIESVSSSNPRPMEWQSASSGLSRSRPFTAVCFATLRKSAKL